MNEEFTFDFSSQQVLRFYMKWKRNEQYSLQMSSKQAISFLDFMHNVVFSELLGYPKILILNDMNGLSLLDISDMNQTINYLFNGKSYCIPFVKIRSINRMKKIGKTIANLSNIHTELHLEFLMSKFGFKKHSGLDKYNMMSKDKISDEIGEITDIISTSVTLRNNKYRTEYSDIGNDQYAYFLTKITNWYHQVLNSDLEHLLKEKLIDNHMLKLLL